MDFFTFPHDLTFYKLLTDWGGLLGALVALLAAATTYLAIRAQIKEAQKEDLEHRALERRNRARERLIGATLIGATLEVLKFDISNVLNTFGPGNDNELIEPERAKWLRQRLRVLVLDAVLPYIDRLEHNAVAQYTFIANITERARDAETTITYGDFRKQLKNIADRAEALQKDVNIQAESALGLLK